MDIESLMIRRPFGSIDPNSSRETELQSADADGRGKLAITLLLLLKLLENNTIKSSTEKQSSAIIVHEPKRTATSTRTIHTRQKKPFEAAAVQQRRCPQLPYSLAV